MSDESKDQQNTQAEHALHYLEIAHTIETGAFDDKESARSLSKDEAEVKESALTCLLSYFVSDFSIGKNSIRNEKRVKKIAKKKVPK